MNAAAAGQDRGIRAIFVSAMNDAPPPPTWRRRLAAACDARTLGHAALGGSFGAGCALLAFLSLALARPATVSADPVPDAPTAAPIAQRAAKADRLPIGGKLAVMASAVEPDLGGHGGRSLAGFGDTTPSLGYAAEERRGTAIAAIDAHTDEPRIDVASLGTGSLMVPGAAAAATRPAGEDDEDDDAIIPVPRARPAPPPTVDALPMPRPRPAHVATLTPAAPEAAGNAASGPEPVEVEAAPAPRARTETAALGFFSSPTEPVKAPPRITVDTPFGVPYVLQTGSVETACIKPELVDILRRIEGKYHRKVVITSGFRDRGRQGSLHRQCAAVDIQVEGVTAETLAGYARSIPGIGGVGTYCHPSMIHVDIGTPRDWKYGCGSFFAMRGAPGKWGRVPTTVAKAGGSDAAGEAASGEN